MCQLCNNFVPGRTIHIVLVSAMLSQLICDGRCMFYYKLQFPVPYLGRNRMFYYTVLFYYILQFQVVQNKRRGTEVKDGAFASVIVTSHAKKEANLQTRYVGSWP